MTTRFATITQKDSNDTWGWNGWLVDRATSTRYPLYKTYIDYELQGEIGYGTCAFETKAEFLAAARRKAKAILGARR